MKIAVIGLGYVGYSNALALAKKHDVTLFDTLEEKLSLVKKGVSLFKDNDIDQYLKQERLSLTIKPSLEEAVKDADYVIVATPTNYDADTNKFDTSSVEQVVNDVIKFNSEAWIIIKSTVGVGFTNKLVKKINFSHILFCPEFLREGQALKDCLFPSRIIVGVTNKDELTISKANELAKIFKDASLKEDVKTFVMGSSEAESVKLFANTFLALRISYFNELDSFALSNELNTKDIIDGVSSDPRIGDFYNNPSFGYGGYCLPKDTKELKANFEKVPENLISAIVESNVTRKEHVANDILKAAFARSQKPIVGIYRLTMKADSDNFRSSSIFDIIDQIKDQVEVVIFEPLLNKEKYNNSRLINDFKEFEKTCDLIVANRVDNTLKNCAEKLYTRDIYNRD